MTTPAPPDDERLTQSLEHAPPVHGEHGDVEAPEVYGAEPQVASNWIEIDRLALAYNRETLAQLIGKGCTIVSVVKGNAYGHGFDPMVGLLEGLGAEHFSVFSIAEAVAFKRVATDRAKLQIMGYVQPELADWVVDNECHPWIGQAEAWPRYREAAERLGKPVRVHLEVETGMNRTGIMPDEALQIAGEIRDHDLVHLEGVCTHLAGAEDHMNAPRLALQKRVYFDFIDRLREAGIPHGKRHIASSAAALLDPEARLDMVRVGIAQYGFWPTREVLHRFPIETGQKALRLERVLTWSSRVMQVHDVQDGDYVGYGRSYQAEGPQRIAIIPVGYADGFSRGLSNLGHVLIRGRRASIIGAVNMNMIQVHVTHIPEVEPGDEVVLIGRQGDQEISVGSFADYNLVVNYELMSRLPVDIPRYVVDGDGPGSRRDREPRAQGPIYRS